MHTITPCHSGLSFDHVLIFLFHFFIYLFIFFNNMSKHVCYDVEFKSD